MTAGTAGCTVPVSSIAETPAISVQFAGYSDNPIVYPSIHCEGYPDTKVDFRHVDSGVEGIGVMGLSRCNLSADGGSDAGFTVAASVGGSVVQSIHFTVDILDDTFVGKDNSQQRAVFFSHGTGRSAAGYVLNYGVTDFPEPFPDQAYAYVGYDGSNWMEDLVNSGYGEMTVGSLVLPAAHDAGMYVSSDPIGSALRVVGICGQKVPSAGFLCGIALVGEQALSNLALTQKDDFASQLRIGTRYFDIRPGYPVGQMPGDANVTHIHNFIPGGHLSDMLDDISAFLSTNTSEFVVLRVHGNGIDTGFFTFQEKASLTAMLQAHIAASVGYAFFEDIATFNGKTLREMAAGTSRVLVQYGADSSVSPPINDSYGSGYEKSLTDPQYVVQAIAAALQACPTGTDQYTVLQLQDTGSGAIEKDVTDIEKFPINWVEDLGFSPYGNVQQATKPVFDASTYNWLIRESTRQGFTVCRTPIVLLNDFVDVALTSHAIGLSKYRYDHPN